MPILLVLSALIAGATDPGPMGTLRVDSHVPADIVVDGVRLAQLYTAGQLEVPIDVGSHEVFITTNGVQRRLQVQVPEGAVARVLVGRNGLSGDVFADTPEVVEFTPVEFRATGLEGIGVRVAGKRIRVGPGAAVRVDLPPGEHPCILNNLDGTVIWARGILHVAGPEVVVLQLTEGRAPEISGEGTFSAATGG
ncbi:MAG: hypothetical protein ACI8PZ_000202 [Myxococcota bacterium]|jgi:hypothetical protein